MIFYNNFPMYICGILNQVVVQTETNCRLPTFFIPQAPHMLG